MFKKEKKNGSLLCRTQTENQTQFEIIIQIFSLVVDTVLLLSKTETQGVCRWIKLKKVGTVLYQGLEMNHTGKIRIFYLSSIKIRYCYFSQVDPESSGWSNTIAAFFFCLFFLFLTFFSPHFFPYTCHST